MHKKGLWRRCRSSASMRLPCPFSKPLCYHRRADLGAEVRRTGTYSAELEADLRAAWMGKLSGLAATKLGLES